MNWNQLLSTKRTGQEHQPKSNIHDRTQFQRDFDRLIFSSPFRRLQDKTQVFPLPGSIFVHNRLTHSLEVSSVGRSLGSNLTRELIEKKKIDNTLVHEIGAVVAAACLAHDMGNPPYGHSGEKAISHFFITGKGKYLQSELSEAQWNDLIDFEGNANALRILTHQFKGRRKGGFAMTYTTVASILKYPYPSGIESQKKYGYFQSEKEIFLQIANDLNLIETSPGIFARHPLVYLVEAADDICYQVMDAEDAHKLKVLSTEEVWSLFTNYFSEPQELESIKNVCREVTDINERIAYLRAKIIGLLVKECTNIFMNHYDQILNGEFKGALIDYLPGHLGEAMKQSQKTAFERIYRHPSVVEIEIAGFKILGTLLEGFVEAVLNPEDYYSKMLIPFIPDQFYVPTNASVYSKVQTVLDFISGMTDVYALDLFRKIKGMGLTNKRF